jgi:hypothetical protein
MSSEFLERPFDDVGSPHDFAFVICACFRSPSTILPCGDLLVCVGWWSNFAWSCHCGGRAAAFTLAMVQGFGLNTASSCLKDKSICRISLASSEIVSDEFCEFAEEDCCWCPAVGGVSETDESESKLEHARVRRLWDQIPEPERVEESAIRPWKRKSWSTTTTMNFGLHEWCTSDRLVVMIDAHNHFLSSRHHHSTKDPLRPRE